MCDWGETAPGVQYLGSPDAGGQGATTEGAEDGVILGPPGDRGHLPHLARGIQTGCQEDRCHLQVVPYIHYEDCQKLICLHLFSAWDSLRHKTKYFKLRRFSGKL